MRIPYTNFKNQVAVSALHNFGLNELKKKIYEKIVNEIT